MSPSFDIPAVDWFTTGTIGPPGQRVFYLQAGAGPQRVTLRLEKVQVAALAQHLAERLSDLPPVEGAEVAATAGEAEQLELVAPVEEEWIVGSLGVSYDEQLDRLFVVAEELVPDEELDEVGEEPPEPFASGARGIARFGLTRGQVGAFVVRAATVVAGGRPPCTLCGRPLDPEGHVCVKQNGHGRR